MNKKLFLILIFIFIVVIRFSGTSQTKLKRQKWFTVGYNVGFLGISPSHLNYSENKDHLHRNAGFISTPDGRGHHTLASNTALGANVGFLWIDKGKKSFSRIIIGTQLNKANYIFYQPFPKYKVEQDNDEDDNDSVPKKWVEADRYVYSSIAFQRTWYIGGDEGGGDPTYWYWRQSFGQTNFHRDQLRNTIVLNGIEDNRKDGTGIVSKTTAFSPTSWMIGTEIGMNAFVNNKKSLFDIGIACYVPLSKTYTREYDVYRNNILSGKSEITFSGVSVTLNISYSYNLRRKSKFSDTTFFSINNNPNFTERSNGRKCKIQKSITVHSQELPIELWDKGIVDGDRISVYLNGELILENYTTTKKKKELILHLMPGKNYIVFHALNLGRIPPNTTAIRLDDGSKKRTITLNSNKHESGAVEINYVP